MRRQYGEYHEFQISSILHVSTNFLYACMPTCLCGVLLRRQVILLFTCFICYQMPFNGLCTANEMYIIKDVSTTTSSTFHIQLILWVNSYLHIFSSDIGVWLFKAPAVLVDEHNSVQLNWWCQGKGTDHSPSGWCSLFLCHFYHQCLNFYPMLILWTVNNHQSWWNIT
jgi:hypothetical protein